jgi:hypothetical protein
MLPFKRAGLLSAKSPFISFARSPRLQRRGGECSSNRSPWREAFPRSFHLIGIYPVPLSPCIGSLSGEHTATPMKKCILARFAMLPICLALFVITSAVAQTPPTPQEVISQLMGTWKGTVTAYYYGKAYTTGTFTSTIEPLGSKGLGFIENTTLYLPKEKPYKSINWYYDTGTSAGTSSQNGVTTDNSTGTWSIDKITITFNDIEGADNSTTQSQYVLIDGQTINLTASSSLDQRAVGTLKRIIAPTLTFDQPITPIAYSYRANFPLTASSTSGGAITYTSSTPSVISVKGKTATIVGVGTATLTATVAAIANYDSATATRTLTVNKSTPTINFLQPKTPVTYVAGKKFTLIASSTSGGAITYTSSSPSVISVAGKTATIKGVG